MQLTHNNLEEYQDPRNYDLEFGGEVDKYAFFLRLAEQQQGSVLELACGTALTALPIAQAGFDVTGVDLAPEMLAYAQHKAHALGVPLRLLHGNALRLNEVLPTQRYDLIYLTGNAFQCFLTPQDQTTLLQGVHALLADEGVFAFETRNPNGTDLSLVETAEPWHTFVDGHGQTVTVSGTQRYDAENAIMHWTTIRRSEGQERHSRIACRFTDRDALNSLLAANGLALEAQYGNWQGDAFSPNSPLIISVCRRAEHP